MSVRQPSRTERDESPSDCRQYDPFTLELIKNSLASIADEMAVTINRTARSFVVKEALDYSTALFLADGQLIAQGTCMPLHLGSMPSAVEAVIRAFGGKMEPGDIFALNDPYDGGSHLPDIIAIKPIFLDDQLIGYSTALAHQTDIGGRVAGGNASDSTEIYQEGLRIPPVHLQKAGKFNDTFFSFLERNVRVPDMVLGDVLAQVAACNAGERELRNLIGKYGLEEYQAYATELLNYTERLTRSEIEKLPDGEYAFIDYLDGDGIEPGLIKIQVKITIKGGDMVIDFTGSAPQVKGAINSVHSFTASSAWACVRSILDLGIPNNSGYFRPIRVVTPERSIVNPKSPAAVAARGLTAYRVADAVCGALAQCVPDKIPACGANHPDIGISLGGYDELGRPFVFLEFLVGSWGGGPDRDGMDACTGLIANYSNTPAELIEAEQPIAVDRYALVPDTGGPGRFRGGLALERHLRFLCDQAVLQLRSDRRDNPPYGLLGGGTGAPSGVTLTRADGSEQVLPSKCLTSVRRGDILKLRLASGGGYGEALERNPELVLSDVMNEKTSLANAREMYGVAIGGMPLEVLIEETEELRRVRRETTNR